MYLDYLSEIITQSKKKRNESWWYSFQIIKFAGVKLKIKKNLSLYEWCLKINLGKSANENGNSQTSNGSIR